MGCGGSKKDDVTKPQLTPPTLPSPAKPNKADIKGEDEVAKVEHKPIRTKSPLNDVDNQANIKFQQKKQQDHFAARSPNTHATEPEQPKIKTSLHFEQVGAAHFALEGLGITQEQPNEGQAKRTDTRELLKDDVNALLVDSQLLE